MTDRSVLADVARQLGGLATPDVPLGPLTTYRVGGPAALLARVEDDADLSVVTAAVGATGVDVLVVGKGSNLLVADAGFPGLAIVLGDGSRHRRRRHHRPRRRRGRPAGGRPPERGRRARRASSGPSACPDRSAARCA